MKLQTKKVIFVGLAFLIISMFWQVYDNVISKMLINSFGLNQTWSGIVMALDNVFALFMLPMFGLLSDKTKTKYGKRTPYIFFGVIISAIFLVGVSVFDDLQNNKMEDYEVKYVVKVEDALFEEDNEYYSYVKGLDKEQMLADHGGDYWFTHEYEDGQLSEIYDFEKIKAEEVPELFKLSDLELSEEKFRILITKFIYENEEHRNGDIKEFGTLINMSHEERTKIEVTSSKGIFAKIFGGEATNSYTRVHGKEISKLEVRLAERILEAYGDDYKGLEKFL